MLNKLFERLIERNEQNLSFIKVIQRTTFELFVGLLCEGQSFGTDTEHCS
jgi:hypothetical protein